MATAKGTKAATGRAPARDVKRQGSKVQTRRQTAANSQGTPAEGAGPTLTEIGREAQRKALLAELDRSDWNLTATAKALGLVNASNVKRSLITLGLEDEFNAAKAAGKIVVGRHGTE